MGTLPENGLAHELRAEMARWEAAGLRRTTDGEDAGGLASCAGGRVDFVSNDYLGLSRHPTLIGAAQEALSTSGTSGRASRLLGGGSIWHARSERAIADWMGAEAALLFPTGYQANLGLACALVGRGDALFCDALNHASLVDAARLSRAHVHVHRHLDNEQLEAQLARAGHARRRLVLTEGIFSMDGDAPDLGALAELCERFGASLVVDEAHAAGIVGPRGAGAWAALDRGAGGPLVARVVTCGKALGVGGAFVLGSRDLREHLVNRARTFAFTTAPPPATAAALELAVGLAADADEARAQLGALARGLSEHLALAPPAGAIVPVPVGGAADTVELARSLAKKGFDVGAVRPPTVPEGTSGLRIVVHAFNTEAECDELARTLGPTLEVARPAEPARPAPARDDMQRALIVVGTDTGIGKTVVSALLLRAALQRGPSAYWKPVQTGAESDTEAVRALTRAPAQALLRPAWSLPLPASPHEAAAEAGQTIDPARLASGLVGLLRTLPDTRIIVELAGGLLVPYRIEPTIETQADWLARSAAPLVLVARSGLGTLNHTLLTLEALRARHLEPRALLLVGEPHESNRRTLARIGGLPHVFELPPLEPLTTESLDAWLATHDLGAIFEA